MAGKRLFFLLAAVCCVRSLQLEKVLLLSRHNLRTPLTAALSDMTPKQWPEWDADVGHLTEKGITLENYMGTFFSQWLKSEGLISERCPDANSVHIYANSRQRTKETGRAFSNAAFGNCTVSVSFRNITEMDPIFNPIVRNGSESYTSAGKLEMQRLLDEIDLNDVYQELNRISDLENSKICKEHSFCDLTKEKDELVFEMGKEPNMTGPFFIALSMVDTFLMSYYEGKPDSEVAWGEVTTDAQWSLLSKLVKQNLNVRFNLTSAKDIARPLLGYMKEKFLSGNETFTMLIGHDSNLKSVLRSLEFEPYELLEQHELTPIGGKLVFQKWNDGEKEFLKVEFVYQTWRQMREAEPLSLENPPKRITLHLNECETDANGFCPWEKFVEIFNKVTE